MMGEREEAIIATKLDILIKDFQRFREKQDTINEGIVHHSSSETEVQAKILTTLNWHTVIGSFMMGTIMYLLYRSHLGIGI